MTTRCNYIVITLSIRDDVDDLANVAFRTIHHCGNSCWFGVSKSSLTSIRDPFATTTT